MVGSKECDDARDVVRSVERRRLSNEGGREERWKNNEREVEVEAEE